MRTSRTGRAGQYVALLAYLLFLVFIWITLVYIIVAFTDITAVRLSSCRLRGGCWAMTLSRRVGRVRPRGGPRAPSYCSRDWTVSTQA